MKSLEKNQDLAKEGNLLKQLLDHERYLWFSKINKYTLLILWLGLLEQMKQKRRKPYSSRMRKKAVDILGGLLTPNIKYQVKEKFKAKLAWTIHSPSQTILSYHQDHLKPVPKIKTSELQEQSPLCQAHMLNKDLSRFMQSFNSRGPNAFSFWELRSF